jgi:hypothetical protein
VVYGAADRVPLGRFRPVYIRVLVLQKSICLEIIEKHAFDADGTLLAGSHSSLDTG